MGLDAENSVLEAQVVSGRHVLSEVAVHGVASNWFVGQPVLCWQGEHTVSEYAVHGIDTKFPGEHDVHGWHTTSELSVGSARIQVSTGHDGDRNSVHCKSLDGVHSAWTNCGKIALT